MTAGRTASQTVIGLTAAATTNAIAIGLALLAATGWRLGQGVTDGNRVD